MAVSRVDGVLDVWAAGWTDHNTEPFLAVFTDDCVYEDVTFGVVNRGKAELRAFANSVFAGVPDFKVEMTRRCVARESAAVEWVMSGTHKGDWPGLPSTGKHFSVRGLSLIEFQAGKIQRVSDYWDAVTLMRQVGLLSSP